MALRHPGVRVEAITVVAGNVPVGQGVQNALYTLELLEQGVPVFCGAEVPLLRGADGQFPRLSHLWLAAGYRGEDKGADWVRKNLGWSVDLVERPRKPAPEEVLMRWAREWAKEGVKADWRKLLPPEGYLVLPRRGGGEDAVVDRAEQEDEQRLRKVVCERRSASVRCHDSPHDEAARPCLRTFHTGSEG
jgi:hypothetical protein